MLAVIGAILPIFGLVLTGWLARKAKIFGPDMTGNLNRFTIYLALPAVLIDSLARAKWSDIWRPGFIAAFGLGAAIVFAGTVLLGFVRRRSLADSTIDGLNTAFANTGFIGFAIAAATLGAEGAPLTAVATILTSCILFAIALVMIEIGIQSEPSTAAMLKKVGRSLALHPLIIAPIVGGIILATGLRTPAPIETFLHLLGAAAAPCALVALGLFLAEKPEETESNWRVTALFVGLKLVAQPALTWFFASEVFHLSPALTRGAVLLAALPTGTGSFMIAQLYRRDAGGTARVVLITTTLSILTITLYLTMSASR